MRFRIDTKRKGNPSSTNIINKLCCNFIRYDRKGCQRHVVELSQPNPSRGRFGQYTGHVGTLLGNIQRYIRILPVTASLNDELQLMKLHHIKLDRFKSI